MAKALLIQLLRIGQFPVKGQLKITWAVPEVESAKNDFFKEHPFLDPNCFKDNSYLRKLLSGNFIPQIAFIELPRSDSQLLADNNFLLSNLSTSTTSIYVCIDDGLDSLAYTSSLASKLCTAADDSDVQLFCYFNYPEHKDYSLFAKTREKVKGLTIIDFGKFLDECSVEAVEARNLDLMARQIAALYEEKYPLAKDAEELKAIGDDKGKRQKFFNRKWRALPENKRESNRQAADHIPVKLRSLQPGMQIVDAIGNDDGTYEKLDKMICQNMTMLSELEHRRWCMDRLLCGWMPLESTDRTLWKSKKKIFQQQKLHIDLVPFGDLPEDVKGKDEEQIRGIPSFLRNLGKTVNIRP